jgi:hypothetical protein
MVDGYHADAFADSDHIHDDRYYRQTELNTAGTINQSLNPVDWTRLKSVPAGFSDGTDDVGGAGDGHSLDAAGGYATDVVYVNEDSDVGINTTEPAATLHVRGSIRAGDPGTGWHLNFYGAGTGTRLYWNAVKGALRSGTDIGGGYWDDARVGEYSVAFGLSAEASGPRSFAVGRMTEAAGDAAVAMGDYSVATGDYAFAVGSHAKAKASRAVAMGRFAEADASDAIAIGEYVEAKASNSIVIGSGESDLSTLQNTVRNSLIVGFDNTEPTLFVDGGSYGEVGIGTVSPDAKLHVTDAVKIGPEGTMLPTANWGLGILAQGSSPHVFPLVIVDPSHEWIVRVQGDGKIGLGLNSPLTRVHITDTDLDLASGALHADVTVVEADDAILGLYSGETGSAGSAVTFGEIASGVLVDKWAIVRETTGDGDSGLRITYGTDNDQFQNSLMMYLDATGKVGIGTKTFGSETFRVNGSACATAWNTCSDLCFKTDIERIRGALDKVSGLSGVLFRWRTEDFEDRGFPEGKHYGLIAQEVEEVLPEAVTSGPDGERSIAYAEMVPLLIESIKELRAENHGLRERIDALEALME